MPARTAPVAPRARRGGHEFSPLGIGRGAPGRDVDLVRAEGVERLKHQAERASGFLGDVSLKDGHGAAGDEHVGTKGPAVGRKKLAAAAEGVEHVADDRG